MLRCSEGRLLNTDVLQQIQEQQFEDRAVAERMLLSFVRDLFPIDVVQVELRPLAVSLNSFNGFLTLADGTRLFFKTHTESNTVIGEYYNASMLAGAGYPMVLPVYSSTETGRQFLIYEVIDDPSVFDVAWSIENGVTDPLAGLTTAQVSADQQLREVYMNTLEWQSADEACEAPIHQLFYHRLAGGRLEDFYGESATIVLPGGSFCMPDVRNMHWTINGRRYDETLNDVIERAKALLTPAQDGPSIIGHGDAHNGNVFYRTKEKELLYFDPAFAGRHDPLLDVTKPLFHNVFAMWMYFPGAKKDMSPVTLRYTDNIFEVRYAYDLPPVRHMFLSSKIENTLLPTLRELKARNWLRPDWRQYIKSSLFCCPMLTMNLADSNKFPPEMSLLGLAHALEMGAEGREGGSLLDHVLDKAESALTG